MSNKKFFSAAAGVIVSGGLLYFALKPINFRDVAAVYARVNPLYVAVYFLIVLVETFWRAYRWKLLLSPDKQKYLSSPPPSSSPIQGEGGDGGKLKDSGKNVGVGTIYRLQFIGFALNNVLPFRLGEIARGTLCGRMTGIPVLTCMSTILVERALDTLSILALFILAINFGGLEFFAPYKNWSWLVMGGVVLGLCALVFLDELMAHSPIFDKFLVRFPLVDRIARQAAMGAESLRSPRRLFSIIASGLFVWLCDGFLFYWTAKTVSLYPPISYMKALVLLSGAAASVSLPSMPGFFGAFEFALMRILKNWGVTDSTAFAYAAFHHVTGYVFVTVIGLVFLYQAGHSLRGIWKTFKKATDATES